MLSFTPVSCVLLLVTITLSAGGIFILSTPVTDTVAVSSTPTVTVELNSTAVLPCSEKCPGVASWTQYSERAEVAECDRTSCRSEKEGYQMIHHQYLQGDLSLNISGADFRKRGQYTCTCDGKTLCAVMLQTKPLMIPVQVKIGETLELDLYILDDVAVTFSRTGAGESSSDRICTVKRHSVLLGPEYSERASVSYVLTLRGVKESASGVYSVWDTMYGDIICNYTVSVYGDSESGHQEDKTIDPSGDGACGAACLAWVFAALLGIVCVCVVCVVCVGVIVRLCSKVQQLQSESVKKEDPEIRVLMSKLDNSTKEQENHQ